MAKTPKPVPSKPSPEQGSKNKSEENSQQDRAPYQQNSDRDPVKSAEETRDIPTKHGTLK